MCSGWDTKSKNVLVNQEGFLHTFQQEELVNLGKRQIQKILKIKRQTYSQGHSQGWRKEVDQRSDGSFTSSARC